MAQKSEASSEKKIAHYFFFFFANSVWFDILLI